MGRRFLWIGISLTVAVVSMIGFGVRYPNNLGIDFKGGDLLLLKHTAPVQLAEVRAQLEPLGLGDVSIQELADPTSKTQFVSIRSPIDTAEKIKTQLEQKLPEAGFSVQQEDKVGNVVDGELCARRSSRWAWG